MSEKVMYNQDYANTNEVFRKACELADIPATSRQASKFRNEKGLAHTNRNSAKKLIAAKHQSK